MVYTPTFKPASFELPSADALLEVLHRDGALLVVEKPADLVCHPTKQGELSSLVGRARLFLGPGATFHLVNRLDRETGGVVLLALEDAAARELRQLWEARRVRKEYLAVVWGDVTEGHGVIEAPLGKDVSSRVAIKDCVRADGAAARTEFFVERRFDLPARFGVHSGKPATLLRVLAHTGRKHQLRIHLAHAGHPIIGDKLYGGDEDLYLALVEGRLTLEQREALVTPCHALHAANVSFNWRGRDWEFASEPEPWFKELMPGGPAREGALMG